MVALDITEVVNNRLKLREEKLKNIQSSKLATVGEMAAGLTYELGNPLTIIQGMTNKIDLLLDRGADKEELKLDVSKVRNASERMGKLIHSLRSFSRDDSKTKLKKTSVKEIIDTTLNLIVYRLDQEGIDFKISEIKDEYQINAQMVFVSQVLVNLFLNSVDAISELDEKWIHLDISDDEENIFIRISDSGSGIAGNIVKQIFQAFYTTKEVGKGTGLGLSLCKEIMSQHNAKLTYETYNGHTSFLLQIPKA